MTDQMEGILSDLLIDGKPLKLFFLGLAKNTGKTTTLNHVLTWLTHQTTRPIVVLSSGYDGEELDAISGLPKPKIALAEHVHFVSTDSLIATCKNQCELLASYSYVTPFGRLILGKALTSIQVPLVSPGSVTAMQGVLKQVDRTVRNPIVLIDGSINRRAFLKIGNTSDHIILATGSAYSSDTDDQINAIAFLRNLVDLPAADENQSGHSVDVLDQDTIQTFANMTVIVPDIASIFVRLETLNQFFQRNNRLLLKRPSPRIALITFNPYNPYMATRCSPELLPTLQKSFPDLLITDIGRYE